MAYELTITFLRNAFDFTLPAETITIFGVDYQDALDYFFTLFPQAGILSAQGPDDDWGFGDEGWGE